MGNHIHKQPQSKGIQKLLKSAPKFNSRHNADEFIIKHNKNRKQSTDINHIEQKRIVFVSLICLYQTWKACPIISLYSAIFMLPLKKDWIYNPQKHTKEVQSSFISHLTIFADTADTEEFIELIKWKDSQGLVFWMSDEYEPIDNGSMIAPFWQFVSQRLAELYDPISRQNYNGLELINPKWWESQPKLSDNIRISNVLSELFFVTMKFKTIKEILCHSHSDALCVVQSYDGITQNCVPTPVAHDLFDEFDENENTDDWWVSPDYDPESCEQNQLSKV